MGWRTGFIRLDHAIRRSVNGAPQRCYYVLDWMELHDSWENRIIRRVIIDRRDEVAVSWGSRGIK